MSAARIQPHLEFGKVPLRRWRSGTLNGHNARTVTVGRLADGQHDAWHSRDLDGAYVYPAEAEAQAKADEWMAAGEWLPIPASFDAWGKPSDGRSWVGHGQSWLPADS